MAIIMRTTIHTNNPARYLISTTMISDTPTDPRHMYAISFHVSLKSDKIFCEMNVICNKNMKEKTKYIN